ncbi:hypothetical protein AAC387_Pa08g0605 [Persea americana]
MLRVSLREAERTQSTKKTRLSPIADRSRQSGGRGQIERAWRCREELLSLQSSLRRGERRDETRRDGRRGWRRDERWRDRGER